MNLAMTISTAPVEEESRISIPRRSGMLRRCVTLSAQPWIRHLEQSVVDRAVRLMAIGTIFKGRWMLPEEWPAPLSVASVTVLVHAGLLELRGIGRAVRIVTRHAPDSLRRRTAFFEVVGVCPELYGHRRAAFVARHAARIGPRIREAGTGAVCRFLPLLHERRMHAGMAPAARGDDARVKGTGRAPNTPSPLERRRDSCRRSSAWCSP